MDPAEQATAAALPRAADDGEWLGRTLARVTTDVEAIGRIATGDLLADPVRLRAVKYSLVTAIEGCVRAAQHVVAAAGLHVPDSDADAVSALGANGLVDAEIAEAVARAVELRDLLVHRYEDVDDHLVVANVALVADLDAFADQLAEWATSGDR